MGVIADQLKQLIKEMEESDRRLKHLVSDHIDKSERAWQLLQEVLDEEDDAVDGFLLDGFPRTDAQARGLAGLLGDAGLDLAVNVDVPDDVHEKLDERNRSRRIPFLRVRPRHWKASISY